MPTTYEEWKAWALAEDERSGADLALAENRSSLYDHPVIRRRYDELAEIRRSGASPARCPPEGDSIRCSAP